MKLFTFHLQPSLDKQIRLWVQGFAHFADGIILLVSFGVLIPRCVLNCARWRMGEDIKNMKRNQK
jgi:hypothetical protein